MHLGDLVGAAPPGLSQFGKAMKEVGGKAHYPATCRS